MPFRNWSHKNDTELSKYIWNLKDQNKDFDIKWFILKKSSGYSNVLKSCNLCLLEKLVILNKRLDLFSNCRQENIYILMNYSGIV